MSGAAYNVEWQDRHGPTRARWTFYDSYVAFPLSTSDGRKEDSVFADVMLGLDAEGGGTLGEFGMRWYRHGHRTFGVADDSGSPRLEVFGDAWAVLAASGLVEWLAGWELRHEPKDWLTPDDFMEALRELGWHDRTPELSDASYTGCPTCGHEGWHGDREIVNWRKRIAREDANG